MSKELHFISKVSHYFSKDIVLLFELISLLFEPISLRFLCFVTLRNEIFRKGILLQMARHNRGVFRRGRRIQKKNAVPYQLLQTISLIGVIQRTKYL